ncbi:MAG: carbohydrate-binding domain-containing protein, partial [Prevotella sp.]|nr:carbohydrate-binding domain-containing protein [Prevotella sp.]
MKKIMYAAMLFASIVITGCSSDDPISEMFDNNSSTPTNTDNGGSSAANASSSELLSFDINIDKTTAEPTSTATAAYPEESDNFDKNSFVAIVNIDMSNPTSKEENGVTITVDGNDVVADHGSQEGICYVVTGTTNDGSLTINGKADFEIELNNADITNTRSTALDIESKYKAFLVLAGSNRLTDGTTADDSHKGALFAKGKLLISGDGSLDVYGTYNNGIHGKSNIVIDKGVNLYVNSTANHGIKAGDDMYINGGIINVEVSAPGAKGINGDIDININGGRTTVVSTANGQWDDEDLETKASAGIACDSVFTMNDGEIYMKSTGSGGKGLKADWEAYINGGKVRIITTGGLYFSDGTTESHNYTGNTDNLDDAYSSSPKGIKIGTKNEHGVL